MHDETRSRIALYTNSNTRRDFLRSAFDTFSSCPQNVLVAVAFLTDAEPLLHLAERGSRLKIIVRLGYPTRPSALRKMLGVEGIQLRGTSQTTFHPKLYIFPRDGAIVGSSNMTQAALNGNQEVNVVIPPTDPCFEELTAVFTEYWDQVEPIEASTLDAYQGMLDRFKASRKELEELETLTQNLLARRIANIDRGKRARARSDFFIEEYRAEYQEFLSAFLTVQRLYDATGRRKYSEVELPLRIEVDAFLGWVRSRYTKGESYLEEPLLAGDALEHKINSALRDWFASAYAHLDDVATRRFPLMCRIFRSPDSLQNATYEEILQALSCATSFHDRLRFFKGGHEAHLKDFRARNSLDRIRDTLSFLAFSTEPLDVRMYRCIYDPQ
ncbi:MAG: phospholipase D-like domain-containing protein [Gemmatimonadaceae bacterium]|jgi:HKD family nuclease|nr:phospholipase D-like domain-containing protein [Gemmatimonadaceae bacterium]